VVDLKMHGENMKLYMKLVVAFHNFSNASKNFKCFSNQISQTAGLVHRLRSFVSRFSEFCEKPLLSPSRHVWPFRMGQLGSHWSDIHEIWYL